MKSDNAPEFKGKRWVSYLETLAVSMQYTEAHHPNQNLAERRGGALKAATVHLLKITGAPLSYWCFALEYVCLIRSVLARRSLDWLTPHEKHWGERPDISVFRFTFWEPVWYYHPRQAFPKPKMLKGRFLGVAQNVGDVFCFLILTEPEGDGLTDPPQVLARSVIRRRFARSDTVNSDTAVDTSPNDSLTFYLNDETTNLVDPPPNAEECDSVEDIIPPPHERCVAFPQETSPGNIDDDGIFEVYGPPVKRHRTLHHTAMDNTPNPDFHPCQQGDTDSEEFLQSSIPSRPLQPSCLPDHAHEELNTDPVQIATIDSTRFHDVTPLTAVNTNSVHLGDDSDDVGGTSHGVGAMNGAVVSQDEDVTPDVLEEVTHQMTRMAEDTKSDELFTRIESHVWEDGILVFRVRWKTDEVTSIPFTLMQRDYPSETAAYILENKVSSNGGRFTSGRFSRWARAYLRHYNKVVRRLLRLSDGDGISSIASQPPFEIKTNWPNGTRLIRRVNAVGKSGKGRRRKKPGRLSRPVQMTYGIAIPQSVREAYALDEASGTTSWADAIRKEIESLLALDCFSFHAPDYKPNSDFQFAKLSMIFEVKQDDR